MAWTLFWQEESGQDLIEYSLLLAFVVLAVAALFVQGGQSISGIMSTTGCNLSQASSVAAS